MLQNVQITTTCMNFEKLLEHKMFVHPCLLLYLLCYLYLLLMLWAVIFDSLNLVAVPTVWIFKKFCDTALLTFFMFATNTTPQPNSLMAFNSNILHISNSMAGNCLKEKYASQIPKSDIKSTTLWITKIQYNKEKLSRLQFLFFDFSQNHQSLVF